MLTDGRIGFIDFGIVGKISPKTWQAVEGLAEGFALQVLASPPPPCPPPY